MLLIKPLEYIPWNGSHRIGSGCPCWHCSWFCICLDTGTAGRINRRARSVPLHRRHRPERITAAAAAMVRMPDRTARMPTATMLMVGMIAAAAKRNRGKIPGVIQQANL